MESPDIRSVWNANAATWTALSRAGFDLHRDLVNTPAFFEMMPPIDGLVGLDLGCGEAHNTRLLAAAGARVLGVDISEVFLHAAASAGSGISFVQADGAVLPFRDTSLAFVTAFMSLMDVEDPETTLHEIGRVLEPGGFVQISIRHPATSTPLRYWMKNEASERQALVIGDYFYEGPLTEQWMFSSASAHLSEPHEPFTITYSRRTLTSWIRAVLSAGLTIEAIDEPHAKADTAHEHPEVADTRVAPYFLILRARKPGG